jgi:flagellar hook-associated protein 2
MSTAGGISFSGLGTGIDTASLVSALMRYERVPITRIQTQVGSVKGEQSVVQEMNTYVKALRDAAEKLYSGTALQTKAAASGDEAVATATATGQAPVGTYNVTVTTLAKAHTLASAPGGTMTAGQTLDLTVGGTLTSVTMAAGDDLSDVAAKINSADDSRVAASVINDRLVLISRTSGGAGGITVGGTGAAGLGLAQTQAGEDAVATINGLQVTSSGNTIEGAVAGLSITLTGQGSTTVSVTDDNSAVQQQVQQFVNAYNTYIANSNTATKYDAATKTAGTLQGDSMFNGFASQLRGIAASAVVGLAGDHTSLSSLGITASRTGELTLDPTRFQAALAADPSAVSKVFGRDDGVEGAGTGDGIARRIRAAADDFSTDALASRLNGYSATIQRYNDRIASLEELMTLREERYKKQFQAMESAVSRLQAQGSNLSSQLAQLTG